MKAGLPGPGQSPGEGKSQGGGQSSGEGQHSGGQQGGDGGAGDGSTNEDSGYAGREQAGGGRLPGEGQEEEYEQIYDPRRLGGDDDPGYVSGQKHEGGSSSYSPAEGIPVQRGVMRPYSEVLPQYSREAASYMEEAQIPAAMKDIVRQYFESLQ